MDPREQAMKSQLDGTFVKFTGKYGEGSWPFETRKVSPDFNPFVETPKPETAKWLAKVQNRKWTVITDAEVETIREMYKQGLSQTRMALALKRHWTTLKPIYDQVAAEMGCVEKKFTRGRKFEWTAERRSQLIELRAKELSWRQIASRLGCSHVSAASEHFALTGERKIASIDRAKNPMHWTPDEDKRLLKLHALGLTNVEIGSRMGRSNYSIGARLARLSGKAWTKRHQFDRLAATHAQ